MKVSGFTIVRNAVKFDYPIVEAITSILSLCDEMIVSVGNSDDDTIGLISRIDSPKIKIIDSIWDESLRVGGHALAKETDKAMDAISAGSDWAFYIQADEVFSEKDIPNIRAAMEEWLGDKNVEGLLFRHINFYGSYDFVADSRQWWKNEIRVIRNSKEIRSWKDAMSFRNGSRKLRVKPVDACIYHYGWVKHPSTQQAKRMEFEKLWHDEAWINTHVSANSNNGEFDYSRIDSLSRFVGEHPQVMQERIRKKNWNFNFDPLKNVKQSLRLRFLKWLEKITGCEIGRFRNYKVI